MVTKYLLLLPERQGPFAKVNTGRSFEHAMKEIDVQELSRLGCLATCLSNALRPCY